MNDIRPDSNLIIIEIRFTLRSITTLQLANCLGSVSISNPLEIGTSLGCGDWRKHLNTSRSVLCLKYLSLTFRSIMSGLAVSIL